MKRAAHQGGLFLWRHPEVVILSERSESKDLLEGSGRSLGCAREDVVKGLGMTL